MTAPRPRRSASARRATGPIPPAPPSPPVEPDGTDPAARFLRLMSHEMRTPLNGVIGMLGLLADTRLDGAQRAYADAARDSAEHLLGLVNDILDYARLDAGSLELDPAPVDPAALARGVAELLSPRAHDKGLEIVWSADAAAPAVLADEGRLRQILFNLAGNAVKFTETGAVRLTVERIGGTARRPRLAFGVEDTGPGVPPEARQRIFEEFGHADRSDAARHDGAGLGLAVARRLAQAMGGVLTVADRPGGPGACFRFAADFDAAPRPAAAGTPGLAGLAVSVRAAHPFVARAALDQIRAAGGRPADDAPVVLADHALAPNGELVPLPEGARALVLLRPSERALIPRYRAAGFDGYLIKPLRPASLIERVRAAGRAAGPQAPASSPAEDDRVAPARFAGVRVLLAEDNPVGALLARTLLRREGCVVETAATGEEALQALKRSRYDLVFMDMRMPGTDGLEATRAARAAGVEAPIVALTANAFAEDRRACLEAGMNDHLVKPLEPVALRAALSRWTNAADRAKVAG